ncbi:hypothetical protein [Methylobacterium radiotolerans]|uniref:hypothetical protein n=1 Tax=Methylobacterium radiotolerans TaxID=31998 RepID=UPI001F163599|nr:hypothetical protein [Methylobacterium radiotolerans]UIY44339.1 hypothetical protein LZ599_11885 [Methylobacterium radiotolerans]
MIAAGLALATGAAALLVAALARPPAALPVIAAMVGVALAFGLVSPNAMHGATERNPEDAGAASAVAVFLQMLAAAIASDLVARFFDGRSALSMAAAMLGCCLAAAAAHAGLARSAPRPLPAPRRTRMIFDPPPGRPST